MQLIHLFNSKASIEVIEVFDMDENRIEEIYNRMNTIINKDERNDIKIGRLRHWVDMLGWEAYPKKPLKM